MSKEEGGCGDQRDTGEPQGEIRIGEETLDVQNQRDGGEREGKRTCPHLFESSPCRGKIGKNVL